MSDPIFYLVALPAVMIAGISKGGLGGGLGVATVPLLSLAVAPPQAAALMLPILCVMDLVGIWAYRGLWDRANMRILLVAALAGIGLGAAMFKYMDVETIRLMVGVIAISFTLRYWHMAWRAWRGGKPVAKRGPSVVRGGLWGTVAGFTSFTAHAGGPPFAVYLLPQGLDRTRYHSTMVVFFLVTNYVKLVPYTLLGQFTPQNLATSAVLFPLAILGAMTGVWLHKRIPDRPFFMVIYALVFVTGCKLVYDGTRALV